MKELGTLYPSIVSHNFTIDTLSGAHNQRIYDLLVLPLLYQELPSRGPEQHR